MKSLLWYDEAEGRRWLALDTMVVVFSLLFLSLLLLFWRRGKLDSERVKGREEVTFLIQVVPVSLVVHEPRLFHHSYHVLLQRQAATPHQYVHPPLAAHCMGSWLNTQLGQSCISSLLLLLLLLAISRCTSSLIITQLGQSRTALCCVVFSELSLHGQLTHN